MSSKKLRTKLERLHENTTPTLKNPPEHNVSAECRQMAEALGGEQISNEAGNFCLIRTSLQQTYTHGTYHLEPTLDRDSLSLSAFSADDQPGQVRLDDLLLIDTETTGLGGAGAVAFLVGVGSIEAGTLEVRQYLLPDYPDEAAMLEGLLEEFSPEKTLVSFNGAAFDLPLLRDRLIVNRVARQIPFAHHIDLLHAARRLYRRRLSDCTLTNLERELFEFHRVGDIPGFLVPSVYFDWLNDQNLDQMKAVIEHNCWDIVSLLFLADNINRILESGGANLEETDDLHSLARLYGRRKQIDRVVELYPQIDQSSRGQLPDDMMLYHSMSFKRAGEIDRAVELWLQLAGFRSREGYLANIELAKHFEHRLKELDRAIKCTRVAMTSCPESPVHKLQIERRMARLLAKKEFLAGSSRIS